MKSSNKPQYYHFTHMPKHALQLMKLHYCAWQNMYVCVFLVKEKAEVDTARHRYDVHTVHFHLWLDQCIQASNLDVAAVVLLVVPCPFLAQGKLHFQLGTPKHSAERFMDCPEGLNDSMWGVGGVG